jgi:hypothetical protein
MEIKDPRYHALDWSSLEPMPVHSYCALRKRRSVIMEILGSAWRGQMIEQSPQSWQTHGSRLATSGCLNPSSA